MAKPVIENRALVANVTRNFATKIAIESIIGSIRTKDLSDIQPKDKTGRKVHVGCCYICNEKEIRLKRKTRKGCDACLKPVCKEHSYDIVRCLGCN